jgi:hypothetical protein
VTRSRIGTGVQPENGGVSEKIDAYSLDPAFLPIQSPSFVPFTMNLSSIWNYVFVYIHGKRITVNQSVLSYNRGCH